ncbi:CBS domain-containing protein/biotin operon repressor [Gracilibacillus halotolerans]|uniref:CBS domain-containing protein/biotin operon repressor n=1 Tax=Gracilibacillus halotolerans TaxID=74386 RepID=A0A841RBJ6_9BACI|nr:helix-turn-helix transcriptional regulator [Gracilibacillus halotolerans]MBB6511260.1 CBS domain-containing protein/biotin operon repressor [Gracilibacillus halotolerans]
MIEFSERQKKIMEILAKHEPITAEQIAELLGVSKGTIRSDLAVLVMTGYIEAKPKVGYFLAKGAQTTKTMEAFKKIKVKDVQGVAITVNGSTTVNDAVISLFLEDVGSLIIVDENHYLEGIVSRKDLLKVTLGNAQATTMPVQMLMTRQPKIYTATPEESVWEAARKLIYYEVDSLPVVKVEENQSQNMKVIGRITKTNIIKALLNLDKEEI